MPRLPITALGLALALLANGCGDLLSLHALSSPPSLVWDSAIEGRWENEDQQLDVMRAGDRYQITLHPKRPPWEDVQWEATLTDLGGVRFVDLLPPDTIGHMFARVRVDSSQLRLTFFDSEWLRQRVPHEEADLQGSRKQAVLIASTPQLRRMLVKFAREPRAFEPREQVWRK